MTTLDPSSVSSSPCSFISAISSIGADRGIHTTDAVTDEHELVSCSQPTAVQNDRQEAGPSKDLPERSESSEPCSESNDTNMAYSSHTLHCELLVQGLEMDRDQGSQQQQERQRHLRLLASSDSMDQDPFHHHPFEDHSCQSHIRQCDLDQDSTLCQGRVQCQERQQADAIAAPFPLPIRTSRQSCLPSSSSEMGSLAIAPATALVSDSASSSYSTVSSSCLCPNCSMVPSRVVLSQEETIPFAFASLEHAPEFSGEAPASTTGGMKRGGEGSNTIMPSLVLWPITSLYHGTETKFCYGSSSGSNNHPVDQPSSADDVDTGVGVGSSTAPSTTRIQPPYSLVHGFRSLHDQLASHHLTSQRAVASASTAVHGLDNLVAKDTEAGLSSSRELYAMPSALSCPATYHTPSRSITRGLPMTMSQQKSGFDRLPREVKVYIFRYLTVFQLVRVSRVSRTWRRLAMDGSLWKVIDTTRYYRTIKDSQLLGLGQAGSGFLRCASFRGCVQLSASSLSAIAEYCPNIERLNITDCRGVTSKAIEDVCKNIPFLSQFELAGLPCVNDNTLQIMGTRCHSLQVLNLSWCKQISGAGLLNLSKGCQELRQLNVSGCPELEDQWMRTIGMNLPKLRELCLNKCSSLTDRGLMDLLWGLSVGSSKGYRRLRMKKKLISSVQISSLGGLLTNHSSYDNDDDLEGEDIDKEEDESERESDIDDDCADDEETDSSHEASGNDPTVPSSSLSTSHGHLLQEDQEIPQARLVYLGLANCQLLTQEGLRGVSQYCSRLLRRLDLSGCKNLDDEGLVHLAQNCTRLKFLDLEEVSLLTDVSLRAFATNLSKLERICLSFCENVTDEGVLRMLRPATLTISSGPASHYCRKLVHLELDSCMSITNNLLAEFARILEERKAAAAERMRERDRKREERRRKFEQKRRQLLSRQQKSRAQDQKQERERRYEGKSEEEQNTGSSRASIERQDPRVDSSSMTFLTRDVIHVSSVPVNIPSHVRHNPSLISTGAVMSCSSSPLQPRSVLASTSLSEEMVIKKTRQGTRIMTPTRSTSTSSTSSSSSLSLWSSIYASRVTGAAHARPKKKIIRPAIQVLDCRNITLEGVEAARNRCPTLRIRSYYSWANPSNTNPAASTILGGSSTFEEGEEGLDLDDDDPDADSNSLNSSQTSLHYVQMQQELLQQQLLHRGRTMGLLSRVRLGLVGATGRHRDAQCIIM